MLGAAEALAVGLLNKEIIMESKPSPKLTKLPKEFTDIFISTKDVIKRFGDGIMLTQIGVLTNRIIFLTKYDDETQSKNALDGRNLITSVLGEKNIVETKVHQLGERQSEILPVIYSQGLVFLCARLENCINEIIAAVIEYDEDILSSDAFRKISISIADYFQLQKDERYLFLAENIIKNIKCGEKGRFDKYEIGLKAFGLGDAINSKYRTELTALFALRNCIVHNGSVINTPFCKQCSWLNYIVGDQIVIDQKKYNSYERVVLGYITEIFYRLNKKMGAPIKYLESVRKNINELFIS
jgi:hypothetical protein